MKKTLLEKNLSEVGVQNVSNNADWKGRPEAIDQEQSDKVDVADNIEEYESNNAVVAELEARLVEVNAALERIAAGTYGTCEVSGDPIEEERLKANPAARTSIAHKDD
jgi:RNA polymerase-binding transcription factor DksA